MFAAVQGDMKRLLAYSSIENIGLLLVGIGLVIIFHVYGKNALAALALTATLYHSINHAYIKRLLFIGTGSILHATGERNMGHLGGLIRRMPWVAATLLIGVLSIAGLPPFNGFISEWLLLQAFLLSPGLPNSHINMLIPVAAAVIALAAALAAYVMVKFYGIIFLGQYREPGLEHAHDAGGWERAGLVWLAAGCVALGLAPVYVVQKLDWSPNVAGARAGKFHIRLAVYRAGGYRARQLQSVYFPLAVVGVMWWLVVHRYIRTRAVTGWIAVSGAERACRILPKGLASRFADCLNPSSRLSGKCRRRLMRSRVTMVRLTIRSGFSCICRSSSSRSGCQRGPR
jgi:formate hydrogenlyase subunit 3/multisubunit Na+/H+ antiporter MnhD subunit